MLFGSGLFQERPAQKSLVHTLWPNSVLTDPKKKLSLKDQAISRMMNTAIIAYQDTKAQYIDESAIDDDDDSWCSEASAVDGGESDMDQKTHFQRIDFNARLSTHRSLITLLIEGQNEKARSLGNSTPRSTSDITQALTIPCHAAMSDISNDSKDCCLMMKRNVRPTLKPTGQWIRSAVQRNRTPSDNSHNHSAASPKTTRVTMLQKELTEDLRRDLLWERHQTFSTANAVLKRRHTSDGIANLRNYPRRRTEFKQRKRHSDNSLHWHKEITW